MGKLFAAALVSTIAFGVKLAPDFTNMSLGDLAEYYHENQGTENFA